MDSVDENGMIAGISKRDLKTKRVCDRTKKVVFVRGTKKQYDAVMDGEFLIDKLRKEVA